MERNGKKQSVRGKRECEPESVGVDVLDDPVPQGNNMILVGASIARLLSQRRYLHLQCKVEVRVGRNTSSVVFDATFPKGEGLSRRFATSRQSVPTKQHVCLLAFALRLHQTFPYKNVRCACSCKPRFYVRKLFSKKVYETPLPSRVTPPFCFLFFCFAGFCFA